MEIVHPDCEGERVPVRCSVCRWITWFHVEVIHEVQDEATWTCEVCNGKEWNGFEVEKDPFPSRP